MFSDWYLRCNFKAIFSSCVNISVGTSQELVIWPDRQKLKLFTVQPSG